MQEIKSIHVKMKVKYPNECMGLFQVLFLLQLGKLITWNIFLVNKIILSEEITEDFR